MFAVLAGSCASDGGGSSAASGGRAAAGAGGVAGSGGGQLGGGAALAGTGGRAQAGATAGGLGGSSAYGGAGGQAGGAVDGGAGGAPPLVPVTVYLAGDSTVQTYEDTASAGDQAGWGQMLHEYLNDLATIENRAIGGRTARRFIDEGRLAEILEDLKEGDYFLVQFGTNDGNKSATYTHEGETIPYYLDPATDFKDYLRQYIEGARSRNATPALVTPPPRNSAYCTGGNGTGAHAQAMRELGAEEGVAVLDLNEKTVAYLKAICPSPEPEDFFLLKGDGSVDGTHFQENGARILAGFVSEAIGASDLALAGYVE